ncbi:MAG: CPBP family intramembrane metalloprotease [Phycisphaerae bacterium]|nr:CPBP family intramembrane metalloprotease [Phycisphaerae bacterium]
MLAIGLLAAAGLIIWLGQSALLLISGRRVGLRVSSSGLSKTGKQVGRVIVNASIAGVVVTYPLLRGQGLVAYYGGLLPADHRAMQCLSGFSIAIFYLSLMYVGWVATDNLRFSVRHKVSRVVRRLAVVPLAAVFGAFAEELLFRGVVMADLLDTFGAVPAAVGGSLLFAGAHYIRRVKRYWTFPGHVMLGVLLCTAFLWTGTLWLPMGLHAGGIFLTLGTRPFVRYNGPAWLVGASIFPYAGLAGVSALVMLTAAMRMLYGGYP